MIKITTPTTIKVPWSATTHLIFSPTFPFPHTVHKFSYPGQNLVLIWYSLFCFSIVYRCARSIWCNFLGMISYLSPFTFQEHKIIPIVVSPTFLIPKIAKYSLYATKYKFKTNEQIAIASQKIGIKISNLVQLFISFQI